MIPHQQYFLALHGESAIKSTKGEWTTLENLSATEIMRLVKRYRALFLRNRYVCWWSKAKADTLEQYVVLRERAWA